MLSTLTLLLVNVADAGSPAAPAQAKVGEAAPDFVLNDLSGKPVKLADQRGKTVVIEWFNPECPFVKYTHADGPLKDMAAKQPADVVWLAVNSGAPGRQGHGVEVNQTAAQAWGMKHSVLIDETGTVGRAYGATSTPGMYVVDPAGVLRYAGALDNAPMGKVDGTPVNYVDQAVTAIRAGQPVATPVTKSYGCGVKYGS